MKTCFSSCLAPAIGLSLSLAATTGALASGPGIEGTYHMETPRIGSLEIEAAGDEYLIRLRGGVPTDQGAATPADCELVAQGGLNEATINGQVFPFEGETVSITEADLAGHDYAVTVTFAGEMADVETNYDGCGLGADLNGRYSRTNGN